MQVPVTAEQARLKSIELESNPSKLQEVHWWFVDKTPETLPQPEIIMAQLIGLYKSKLHADAREEQFASAALVSNLN
eukprot:2798235-Rhodomonas_salina.1